MLLDISWGGFNCQFSVGGNGRQFVLMMKEHLHCLELFQPCQDMYYSCGVDMVTSVKCGNKCGQLCGQLFNPAKICTAAVECVW